MILPTFIHIGPQRCGTTFLYDSLAALNCVPRQVKEIQFFDKHFDLGLEWYSRHFEGFQNGSRVGEICPSYFDHIQAISRIEASIPQIKIICTLRNPLSRVPSYYRLLRMYDLCPEGLEAAWQSNKELRDCCMYSERLKAWQATFGDCFRILLFDDLVRNPKLYFEQFSDFTGIELPHGGIPDMQAPEVEPVPRFPVFSKWAARVGTVLRRHRMYKTLETVRGVVKPLIFNLGTPQDKIEVTPTLKNTMKQYYRQEILRLSDLTGSDLSSWLA